MASPFVLKATFTLLDAGGNDVGAKIGIALNAEAIQVARKWSVAEMADALRAAILANASEFATQIAAVESKANATAEGQAELWQTSQR